MGIGSNGSAMKHRVTKELYAYWLNIRGQRRAPERSEIEPADIRTILGDTFILEVAGRNEYRFRLAGTRVCAVYGRELKGKDFLSVLDAKDRASVSTMMASVVENATGIVLGLVGRSDRGVDLPFECLMLPIHQSGQGLTRILGSLVPMDDPYWIGLHPILDQRVSSIRLVMPDEHAWSLKSRGHDPIVPPAITMTPPLTFSQKNDDLPTFQRKVAHLTVFEGGKQ